MIEIKDLLLKFDRILLSEGSKKESIREAISGILGIEIKAEDIKIKGDTLYLDIKPIYKSEILLKSDRISAALNELLGKKTPRNIR